MASPFNCFIQSAWFSDFLFNTDKERMSQEKFLEKCCSIWFKIYYFLCINVFRLIVDSNKKLMLNNFYEYKNVPLFPACNQKHLQFWSALYLPYDREASPVLRAKVRRPSVTQNSTKAAATSSVVPVLLAWCMSVSAILLLQLVEEPVMVQQHEVRHAPAVPVVWQDSHRCFWTKTTGSFYLY